MVTLAAGSQFGPASVRNKLLEIRIAMVSRASPYLGSLTDPNACPSSRNSWSSTHACAPGIAPTQPNTRTLINLTRHPVPRDQAA
jgi:hypothetical protein